MGSESEHKRSAAQNLRILFADQTKNRKVAVVLLCIIVLGIVFNFISNVSSHKELTVEAKLHQDQHHILSAVSTNEEEYGPIVDTMLSRMQRIKIKSTVKKPLDGTFYNDFRKLNDVVARMKWIASAFKENIVFGRIGYSAEKRPVYALRVSATTKPNVLPNILLIGGEHGREWITPMGTLLSTEKLLLENKDLLEYVNVYIVPILNVDGYEFSWTNDDEARFWRKNRQMNEDGTIGIDLNRNWGSEGFTWGHGQTWSSSEVYMGTKPFEAAETNMILNWIKSNKKDSRTIAQRHTNQKPKSLIASWVSVHCCTGTILQTRNFCTVAPEIEKLHGILGRRMVKAMNSIGHGKYTFSQRRKTLEISSSGVSVDWAFYDMEIPFPYIIETSISKEKLEQRKADKLKRQEENSSKSIKEIKEQRKANIRDKMSADDGEDIVPVGEELHQAFIELLRIFQNEQTAEMKHFFPPLGFYGLVESYYQCKVKGKPDLTPRDCSKGNVDKPWISCHKEKAGKKKSRKGKA